MRRDALVDGKPVLGIIVEIQLRPDPDKRPSWPVYVAALRARLGCPACLLVVAEARDEAVEDRELVWFPGMDSNHHSQVQSLLSCR